MWLRRFVLAAAGTALLGAPATSAVKVGDPAPAMALDSILPPQPAENAGLTALAGKAVVLEFWATWCGPCVDAIPHLNQLADRFADRPIRFLSITGEDTAVVEKFLKERPIRGCIGFDKGNRLLHAYGFEGIPETVLIDANGKVAGLTYPSGVTAAVLEDLLAGRALKLPPRGPDFAPLSSTAEGPAPLLNLIVRPAPGNRGSKMMGAGKYEVRSYPVRALLSDAFGIPAEFIEGEAANDPAGYDISVVGPKNQTEALRKLRADALAIALQLDVNRETRVLDGWILEAPHGKPKSWNETAASGSVMNWGNNKFHATGAGMAQVALVVQSVTRKPVADRTGITARFDFDVPYDESRSESLLDALRKCGLKFQPAKLGAEFLVVTRRRDL
jgi:uncharacterized protein (TIGR03435 family)